MTCTVIPLRMADHREDLIRLWTNFNNLRIAGKEGERLSWFYDQNPLGPAKTWLVVDDNDNRIIGCGSIFPTNKHVNGRLLKAGVPSEFAVESTRRTAGPAVALQRALLAGYPSEGFEFLIGAANHKSLPVCLRVGYRSIGTATRWVKPLQGEYWLSRYLKSPFLTKAAGFLVTCAFALLDRRHFTERGSVWSCEDLEKVDERFDDLWNRGKHLCRIAGERNARYLNWRYTACPERKYRFYVLLDRDDQRLLAYLAYSINGQEVTVADVFGETPQSTAIDALLLRFSDRMRAEGRHSLALTYFGNTVFEKHLQRLGFFRREKSQTVVLHAGSALPEDIRTTLSSADHWCLFSGEMDV
ncbi:MAG: hypothetical protein WC859_04120 [Elusimicrobiota bacterium]|jgi:hypothetical protein